MNIIKQGQTNVTDWKENVIGGGGIYVEIDTSFAEFNDTPHYIATLEGNTHHWDASGINAIYNSSKNRFRIYLKWIYKQEEELTVAKAIEYGWYVKWTGIITE